ncbi:MAG: protein kinase [Elusimicrobiota bacterium]|jgi:ActR/RegA family two-component response regulator
MPEERSILIVDDDESQLEFCAAAAQLSGFSVSVASNTDRAIALLRAAPFDAVLTDHMPAPAGKSWVRELRMIRPSSVVIVMTGRPDLQEALAMVAEGARDYLPKPFSAARLREALERCFCSSPAQPDAQIDWLRVLFDDFLRKLARLPVSSSEGHVRILVETSLPSPLEPGALAGMLKRFSGELPAAQNPVYGTLSGEHLPRKFGRYTALRRLSSGVMGNVYFALDERIGRPVALKVADLDPRWDPHIVETLKRRFFREAEAAGRLNHPAIVRVHDVGEVGSCAYIAMEYLDGESLDKRVRAESMLSVPEALAAASTVAQALDCAHRHGVVHRDVKPGNILRLMDDGSLRLTDFGIAIYPGCGDQELGGWTGTPFYMSPEHIAGLPVDGRADLFALGVTLFELLAGERPWKGGETLESILYQIQCEPPPSLAALRPDIPPALVPVVERCLAKDPQDRYPTGAELAAALEQFL